MMSPRGTFVLLILLFGLCFAFTVSAQGGVVNIGGNAELGAFLVAQNGMTLYTFANDQPGISNCVGQCLNLWPAYIVDATVPLTPGPGVTGAISAILLPDGRLHVTYNDAPLYFYSQDLNPGDANGQGVGSVWFVVAVEVAPAPVQSGPQEFLLDIGFSRDLGSILTASNGRTLYTFANDQPGVSNCVGNCINLWPPYTTDANIALSGAPGISGVVGTLQRADGATQVTYDGAPLYLYSGDSAPGDINGHGVGDVWFSVGLDVVRVGGSTSGWFLVDGDGRTLYTFANDEPLWSNCLGDCAVNWPPLAFPIDQPVISSAGIEGALATTLRADGAYQVAFNQRPLYRFSGDTGPNETNGDGAGGVWSIVRVARVAQLGGNAELGTFLVDDHFRTLYVFANDQVGVSNCLGDCTVNWPPLSVPAGVAPVAAGALPGTLGTITRADGIIQVTYDGRPLYTFANDRAAGDALGNGAGGVWSIVPFPQFPFRAPATCTVTPIGQTVNLRQAASVSSFSPRTIGFGQQVTVDGQTLSEGYVWWHLTTGEWVRSDVVSQVTPCDAVPVHGSPQLPGPGGVPAPAPAGTQPVAPAPAPTQPPPAPAPATTPNVSG